MHPRLSAMAAAAILTCAGTVALAGPTVTTTQTGTGNSAYAEQSAVNDAASARFTASIAQSGSANDASIYQH